MSDIAKALQVASKAIEDHLQLRQKRAEEWVVVSTLVDGQWTPLDGTADKLVLCLSNIAIGEAVGAVPSLLPVQFDLAIIANFTGRSYATGLSLLSSVVGFFQSRRTFGGTELGIAPITIDLINPEPAAVDRAMRMLGTPYLPALFCKVGLSFAKVDQRYAALALPPAGPPKPGVYVPEPSGPPGIVPVRTDVPIFIGSSEQAAQTALISSLDDYESLFGSGETPLHAALRLFYDTGGGDCYVLPCGRGADLQKGIDTAALQVGPSMVVVPELGQLTAYLESSCASLGDRVAVLDGTLPAAAIAGTWAQNDRNNGVWTTPGPIAVRRTLIYIEQSIRRGLQQIVFAPNTAETWASVTAMIEEFLAALWSQGGLVGETPEQAFTVQCGLDDAMSAQDVLDGYLRVEVKVQVGDYRVLTFQQQMEG